MKYKAILFDLDGTLLDTLDDIADSMNEVLESSGFPVHPADSYRTLVGDGIGDCRCVVGVGDRDIELVFDESGRSVRGADSYRHGAHIPVGRGTGERACSSVETEPSRQ